MKSRITASIYLFHAGCRANIRNTTPSISMVTHLCRRRCLISSSFQAQGSDTSSRAAHSAAIQDDAFSELGPAISKSSAKQVKLVTEKRDPVMLASFQAQGSDTSSRAAPSAAIKDEAFSDLGPAISKSSAKQVKLVTEKRDPVMKKYSSRKLGSTPLSSDRPSLKEIVATIGQTSPVPNSKIGDTKKSSDAESQGSVYVKNTLPTVGLSEVSNSKTGDTKRSSDAENKSSVYVKNIQPTVGLSELVESVSVFGKVYSASFINASNGLRYCNIQFEDVDSSRRAILAGKVAVGSEVFPVQPIDAVDVVAIRIKNIKKETTDHVIHSICNRVGEFVGLARTSKDVVDTFFNVRNDKKHLNILKTLNSMVIDANRWSAHVLTSESKSSEESSAEEARYKLGLRIFDQCADLKEQLTLTRVCLEDLEVLNASIMHIEGLGANLSGSK